MLTQLCESLPGVGLTLAAKLAKCGISTLQDLLFHLPFRYQDRTRISPIQDVRANDWSVVVGRVCKEEVKYGKSMMLYCHIEDKTGLLRLRFFHFNKQQIKNLEESSIIPAFGEVREFSQRLEMIHPEDHILKADEEFIVEETLTPIYPTTQGLSQARIRQLVKKTLSNCKHDLNQLEWMSEAQLKDHDFHSLSLALECLHSPSPEIPLQSFENGTHPALQRVVFDELLAQRLSMQFARQQRSTLKAPALLVDSDLQNSFLKNLGSRAK